MSRIFDSHWTTTLPEDLLTEQAIRLQLLYAVGVILWAINFAMDLHLAALPTAGHPSC